MIDFSEQSVFVKINAKEDTATAQQFGVVGYPTVVLLNSGGQEIDRIFGYRGPEPFLQQIEDYLAGRGTFATVIEKLKADPDNIELLLDVGERYYARGKFEEAAVHYEKVISLDPKNESGKKAEASFYVGYFYQRAGKKEDAITAYESFIKEFPTHEDAEWAREQIEKLKGKQ
ncbi:MAG: tetratricopeptide repeat protein [bacterium]